MNDDNWANLHKRYAEKDWSKLPSIFATEVLPHLPHQGSLLELGAGVGQDGIYFSENGYEVTATDLFTNAVDAAIADKSARHITTKPLDLRKPFAFDNDSFDIVYAHLSLHYFSREITQQIFDEIYRILKPGGILAFFTNSTSDPEYGTGDKIEDNYFMVEGIAKRYFSVESLEPFLERFEITLLDANGETYKDRAIGVHNLIRAIVKKPL